MMLGWVGYDEDSTTFESYGGGRGVRARRVVVRHGHHNPSASCIHTLNYGKNEPKGTKRNVIRNKGGYDHGSGSRQ